MDQEKEIIYKMRDVANELLLTFYQTKESIDEIEKNIDNNTKTNYFTENPELFHRFQQIISEINIPNLTFLLQDFKCYANFKLDSYCDHEWINDDIDINPDRSQRITYCCKCSVTQK
jgi:hypothetical protein